MQLNIQLASDRTESLMVFEDETASQVASRLLGEMGLNEQESKILEEHISCLLGKGIDQHVSGTMS